MDVTGGGGEDEGGEESKEGWFEGVHCGGCLEKKKQEWEMVEEESVDAGIGSWLVSV